MKTIILFFIGICCTSSTTLSNYNLCYILVEDVTNRSQYKGEIDLVKQNIVLNSEGSERKFNKLVKDFNFNLLNDRQNLNEQLDIFNQSFEKEKEDLHSTTFKGPTKDNIHYNIEIQFSRTRETELPRKLSLTLVNERTGEENLEQIWHFYGYE